MATANATITFTVADQSKLIVVDREGEYEYQGDAEFSVNDDGHLFIISPSGRYIAAHPAGQWVAVSRR